MFRGFKTRKDVKKGVDAYEKIMADEFNFHKDEGKGFGPLIKNKEYDEKMAEFVDLQNKLSGMGVSSTATDGPKHDSLSSTKP